MKRDQVREPLHAACLSSVRTFLTLGIITGVDEENAFSWPVCDGCGSDRLLEAGNASRLDHSLQYQGFMKDGLV